jgi:hypothetical protein
MKSVIVTNRCTGGMSLAGKFGLGRRSSCALPSALCFPRFQLTDSLVRKHAIRGRPEYIHTACES